MRWCPWPIVLKKVSPVQSAFGFSQANNEKWLQKSLQGNKFTDFTDFELEPCLHSFTAQSIGRRPRVIANEFTLIWFASHLILRCCVPANTGVCEVAPADDIGAPANWVDPISLAGAWRQEGRGLLVPVWQSQGRVWQWGDIRSKKAVLTKWVSDRQRGKMSSSSSSALLFLCIGFSATIAITVEPKEAAFKGDFSVWCSCNVARLLMMSSF